MKTASAGLGAHVSEAGTLFRAFAEAERCEVLVVDEQDATVLRADLRALGDGYFELLAPSVRAGALYWFVVDGRTLPDPYARYLPRGVHGPAQVVASSYAFRHPRPVRPLSQQVIYELHIGTFTEEGTFAAARQRLPELVELGITTLELMPVAAFAGERNWGYDGVALFAPHAAYGTPEELCELVDAAHGLGLAVLLDVVYNHFGPAGNYLSAYASSYFSATLENAWGKCPDFTQPAMRQLVLDNARYWLGQFAFDGLRLDATHAIVDASQPHLLEELAKLAHEAAPPQLVIAEDERNQADLVTRSGLDALWADDFHHQLRVTLTGERFAYYAAYEPSAQGVADVINRGWAYRGQVNPVSGEPRGTSADELPAQALVYCIQNHDQVGNRAFGERSTAQLSQAAFRGASLLLLFLPMTPLLFMGQEWGASTPFLYFTDHEAELGRAVSEGRRREFAGFPGFSDPESLATIPDPQALGTFRSSKLLWSERDQPEHRRTLELYRAALALRRADPVLTRAGREGLVAEAAGQVLIVHRFLGDARRVLVMNLGDAPVSLASLSDRLRLSSAKVLLQSSGESGSSLSFGDALVLAGEGTLAEVGEGAA